MQKLSDLKKIVKEGITLIKKEKGLIEAVVYASSNHRTVGRICLSTHIPSSGLQEPKSDEDFGLSVEIWFEKDGKKLLGFGQEPNDLSDEAVYRSLQKAKRDAVEDKDFTGFLKKDELPKKYNLPKNYHDKSLMNISSWAEAKLLSELSWETISGATEVISQYASSKHKKIEDLDFILNGDNFLIRERMAVASTDGIFDSDETTVNLVFLTAMIESENAKGSAWDASHEMKTKNAYQVGENVAKAAINQIGGIKVPSGEYKVVFGPQAVTELFGGLMVNHLSLALIDLGASIYQGKYGQEVASPLLTLYDDATFPNGAGSKRVTCEGRHTEKTLLIDKGHLVGYLSDSKTRNKMVKRALESKLKIGVDPSNILNAILPRNGFRFARGGGRIASSRVGISATNLVIDSPNPLSASQILRKVKNGLYIGRLWYTYPVGGYATGIISGTAIADNFVIRNGKLAEPILPNSLRLEDNIGDLMKNIIAVGNRRVQTIVWASDEITHAPWVAIKNVKMKFI